MGYNVINSHGIKEAVMDTEGYVKLIFSKMICSCCDQQFTPDCVEIIRIEGNVAVVKIVCTHCGKNYGIAMVGIETIGGENEEQDEVLTPGLPPINTDDVIEAHKFIESMGDDWTKYIPEEFKNIE